MLHTCDDDRLPLPVARRALLRRFAIGLVSASAGLFLLDCGGSAPATAGSTTVAAATSRPAATTRAASTVSSSPAASTAAKTTTGPATAAAAAAPGAKGLTLEVASWLKTEQQKDAYKQLIAAYAKVRPDVKVVQALIPGTLAEYESKVTAQLAGGTAPDLMETIWGLSQPLGVKGALQPLDPYIGRDKIAIKDYVQPALELGRWPQGTGKYYAWYTMFSTSPLFYNTAMFQAAGQAPPDESWTWQHAAEVAQKLTKTSGPADQQTYGLQIAYLTRTLLYSYGWDFASPDLSQCLLDSPQSIDGMQFWQDLIYKYQVSPTPGSDFAKGVTYGAFATLRLGMILHASYQVPAYQTVKGLQWDIALPPKGPAGRVAILKGAPAHSLPAQSPHASDAWAFLSWWIRNQTPELIVNPGNLPSRLAALADWKDQQRRASATPAHIDVIYDIATKYTRPVQVLPNNDIVKAPYYKERGLILQNKESAKTGMTNACQAMMGLLKAAQAQEG